MFGELVQRDSVWLPVLCLSEFDAFVRALEIDGLEWMFEVVELLALELRELFLQFLGFNRTIFEFLESIIQLDLALQVLFEKVGLFEAVQVGVVCHR